MTYTYTDKQFYFAIANADNSLLEPIFGVNTVEAVQKASTKLASLNNRKRSPRKYTSKRLVNLALFNDQVAPYLNEVQFATLEDIRQRKLSGASTSKAAAVLRVAVEEGLVERHEVKASDNFTVNCGTYYTVPGYKFEKKTA